MGYVVPGGHSLEPGPIPDAGGDPRPCCRAGRLRTAGKLVSARGRGGRAGLALGWVCAALICAVGLRDIAARLARVPVPIDREEAQQIWSWIRQVGPDAAVLADYEVAAPLSSRRWLYSYVLDVNRPSAIPSSIATFFGCSSGLTIHSSRCCWNRGLRSFTAGDT